MSNAYESITSCSVPPPSTEEYSSLSFSCPTHPPLSYFESSIVSRLGHLGYTHPVAPKLFIPLSMLTTATIAHIRFNEDLKFKRIPFGPMVGKYTLDDMLFPAEATLSDFDYMQVHRHWTELIKVAMQTAIYKGWKAHHEQMVGDEHLRTSARAWHRHNRNLRVQFMIQPYIIDPASVIYNQQYEWIRINLLSNAVKAPSASHGDTPSQHYPSLPSSSSFHPYDKDRERKSSSSFRNTREARPVLCIRCGHWGHRALACHNNKSTRLNHPIIVSWKVDKLVSKQGRHICLLFNVRGNCSPTSSPHPEHSCSLCGNPHHGAANCSRTELHSVLYKHISLYIPSA